MTYAPPEREFLMFSDSLVSMGAGTPWVSPGLRRVGISSVTGREVRGWAARKKDRSTSTS